MKKTHQASESLALIAVLMLSGGFVGAYSYLCRGRVFANAQSGNILLMGINLSEGNFAVALRYLVPVLAFASGVAFVEMLRHRLRPIHPLRYYQVTLLAEALVLGAVAFMPQGLNPLAASLISFTCGAQVESFRDVRGRGIATTMCVGNLRSGAQALCNYVLTKNTEEKDNGCLYFGIIGIFTLGAILGNFCVGLWQEKAILVSVGLLLAGFAYLSASKEP